ncbi:MAG: hypothetical protein WC362_04995 [Methanoregula sp.]|jgi:hypothetical protein
MQSGSGYRNIPFVYRTDPGVRPAQATWMTVQGNWLNAGYRGVPSMNGVSIAHGDKNGELIF